MDHAFDGVSLMLDAMRCYLLKLWCHHLRGGVLSSDRVLIDSLTRCGRLHHQRDHRSDSVLEPAGVSMSSTDVIR